MDGRADGTVTKRTAQGMIGVGVGFTVLNHVTIGIESAVSGLELGEPANDVATVSWTAAGIAYRF